MPQWDFRNSEAIASMVIRLSAQTISRMHSTSSVVPEEERPFRRSSSMLPRRQTCYPQGLNGLCSHVMNPQSRIGDICKTTVRRRMLQHGHSDRRPGLWLPWRCITDRSAFNGVINDQTGRTNG
ncbi:hypothetical protein TNCV_5140771 [Trichonephila clavipes]|nr:hypothetical protein TNCV_5140771 [Trichonephila clavipes]